MKTAGYMYQNWILNVILTALLIGNYSCGNKHDYPDTLRPHLSKSHVDIPLGKTVEIEVIDAESVSVECSSRFVDITIDGTNINILGKMVGEGDIHVIGDRTSLRCTFEVFKGGNNYDDSSIENAEEAYLQELSDDNIRLIYNNHVIRFDSPGNLFAFSPDWKTLIVCSLETGLEIKVMTEETTIMDFLSYGNALQSDATMMINGNEIHLNEFKVVKTSPDRIWIHGMSCDSADFWLVMNKE